MYKVWLEVSRKALAHNIRFFRSRLKAGTKLYAVVKSNAYGHGLITFAELANQLGVDGFCVDSVIEGIKLRQAAIKKPILVLGSSLDNLLEVAAQKRIIATVSNYSALRAIHLLPAKKRPVFHLKIDTGMHRQGFYPEQVKAVLQSGLRPTGVYSHLAAADNRKFSEQQRQEFIRAVEQLKGKFPGIQSHLAATGGALLGTDYHFDLVRIGMGLYGYNHPRLKPIISWQTLISEIKNLKPGDFVGYDLTQKIKKPTRMAVLPIGYWHGFPRALSGMGEVLIKGRSCPVLGRVSMDVLTVDIGRLNCRVGDRATVIGKQKNKAITAQDIAQKLGGGARGSHYEILTRINPLIHKEIVLK